MTEIKAYIKDIQKHKAKTTKELLECIADAKTSLDLKLLYNIIERRRRDKTPAYYSITKENKTITFNKDYQLLSYDYNKTTEKLKPTCPRAHIHSIDFSTIKEEIRIALAYRFGLKLLKNGTLSVKARKEIDEYLSF